ncbi:branched-chain amino acid ABC transporter permease [Herbiconiux sp. L3-i23]|uniref:branched-chain amino acid ABC transporter permease n=1 Tax=Herbiconiux sp. L3-i23 TaxID=2905871 RepID=UPI002064E845|nr:branched-chain amino acid ABC transporter permease [Herbiconiux sp. L3-i23]BDI22527.1 branched-chain amino acid ABC transporter permease [Herbiconiux sp. L3-i23]
MLESLVAGLVNGAAYAILAVCIVVLYRLGGVLNVGQAALGGLGAYSCYTLLGLGVPLPVAAILGVAAAASASALAGGLFARWFAEPTETVRATVAVVLLILVLTLGFRLFGDSPRVMPSLVPAVSFDLGGVRVSLTTVVALALTFLLAGGLSLLLSRTQIGLRLQAMSERPTTAQLLGVNSHRLAIGAWAATGAVSTLAMLLVAPTRNPTFETMAFLVVPALAAGLLGAFTNVWVAAAGGLAIGALEGVGVHLPLVADYRGALPFVIIIVALIWQRRREVWGEAR